jgi:TIR domain
MFLDYLYGGIDEPELKIIDVFNCKLRKKIAAATGGQHYIETVWGKGYVLKDPGSGTVTPPIDIENEFRKSFLELLDESNKENLFVFRYQSFGSINPSSKSKRQIFLAHAKEDKKYVRDLYAKLKGLGFSPWLDEKDLLPGQNWKNKN